MRFKVNEIFFSLQGEGRGPLRKRKPQAPREREHSAVRCAIGG
jgi:hypothetical protein